MWWLVINIFIIAINAYAAYLEAKDHAIFFIINGLAVIVVLWLTLDRLGRMYAKKKKDSTKD